ncbi:isocitrate lyase/PEP mutase family protein [Rhizorhabdus dicambivorans]|uniref:Carboxyvinyl-carboxyphosphonate phosphorylmutase n=1 Tax=Rhizorhabdus dicambivorans TaxID=1850238 RepID=A0A2A4FVZ7_9SPHN|nr:isocitrate lyase/PEP mutase family protein [Rhizorhabdus dicambivorans]ATE64108.1 carboxyvinyl-carboxyphosphonate phosphorylmutase [Rhizorhabdus dicambivorans]PCE42619.1 carboxyvinyl-carboxyphosphonate phosphorylmutase [Rhizorhabdus dicambivorans]
MSDRAKRFRAVLEARAGTVIPGCHDALGARLIEQAGFPIAYMSGFAVSGTLGLPDIGLMPLAEMARRTAEVAGSISLPFFVDADNGYGDARATADTVRQLEGAGAVGVHIDDQILPRPAGASKALVPIEDMQAKIAAACGARTSPDFTVIGRTDAMATDGFEAALHRAEALQEAGADALMMMYLTDRAQVIDAVKRLRKPLVLVVTETARKSFRAEELVGAGHAAVIYTLSTLLASLAAQRAVLANLAQAGDTEDSIPHMMPMDEVRPLTGLR